jgi:hypothetical protein
MGSAHSMKDARRPRASAKLPPTRLPAAAPMSVLLTTFDGRGVRPVWAAQKGRISLHTPLAGIATSSSHKLGPL